MLEQNKNEQIKGRQPAMSPSLEAACRHNGVKCPGQGIEAIPETAPKPADPDARNAGAEKMLHENAASDVAHRK